MNPVIRILLIIVLGIVAFWLLFWTLVVLSPSNNVNPAPVPNPSSITRIQDQYNDGTG